MEYDIIFVVGEIYFDHPLCGTAILKRLLEKYGYTVAVIEMPTQEAEITKFGKPKLFFGVSSGAIDSMVRNYTPMKKLRKDDKNLDYNEAVPDRAVIVFSNWIRKNFKDSKIIIGGVEASLRRFTHYDYWDNKVRKPILMDSRADILAYGPAERQILEIATRIKDGKELDGIQGTCVIRHEMPTDFNLMPSCEEVIESKDKYCDMQNMLTNRKNLAQKVQNRFVLQYKMPQYTSKDLDAYYELPFTRKIPPAYLHLRGFEFSVVTHRGCFGGCNFCSLSLMQGDRIVSRSEESVVKEIQKMTKLEHFKGNIDDLGGPTANMYGMDCYKCEGTCLSCGTLDRSNSKLLSLMRKAREVKGIRNVYVKSGIRFDLCSPEYLKELVQFHVFDTLRIAPEHVNKDVLKLMNKDYGDLSKFISDFNKLKSSKELSFYFMNAHPGSGMKEAAELSNFIKSVKNAETTQVFTPTPMTVSTCMYYTSMEPKNKRKIYVPYTYIEKKEQKRLILNNGKQNIKQVRDQRGFGKDKARYRN